jgi:hypothetical protein
VHGGSIPALARRGHLGCRSCWMVVEVHHDGSYDAIPAHEGERCVVSRVWCSTAQMRLGCVVGGHHRAVDVRGMRWVACCKHRRQLATAQWRAEPTNMHHGCESPALVQEPAMLREVRGFWSDLHQKLRTDVSFPTLPSAAHASRAISLVSQKLCSHVVR